MVDILYVIIAIIIITCISLTGLFFLISPLDFYNLCRINYYCCYITENGTVIKRLIKRAKGQWYLDYKKRAYLIPFGNMVKYKNGNIFYTDIHNVLSIKCLSKEQQELIDKIKAEPRIKKGNLTRAREVLSRIPLINMFVTMKSSEIDEVVFANKFILNPDFIIDSAQFYIMLTQDITKKILAKPKSFADIIEAYLPLIIIGVIVIVIVAIYIQSKQAGVQNV